MSDNLLRLLHDYGVSVWLDYLSRDLISSGRLKRFLDEDGVRGETSNPTIFQKAISEGTAYDAQILEKARQGLGPEPICWTLMATDIQAACQVFRPLYDESRGADGYVSLELHPSLAHDSQASLNQARELRQIVTDPNVMFKVPGTSEGLPVVRQLTAEGFNVNITLLFSVDRYAEVMEAWMSGLEERVLLGQPIEQIASVASFFVSRVDTEADKRMDALVKGRPELASTVEGLRGQVAVANARVAYERFEQAFGGPRWEKLQALGCRVQRPLWASTGTKNPAYSDILYVKELIGPHCVNTMPEETMDAFRDHGVLQQTLTAENLQQAHDVLRRLASIDVDLADITLNTLVKEGVEKFEKSYHDLQAAVAREREKLLQTV